MYEANTKTLLPPSLMSRAWVSERENKQNWYSRKYFLCSLTSLRYKASPATHHKSILFLFNKRNSWCQCACIHFVRQSWTRNFQLSDEGVSYGFLAQHSRSTDSNTSSFVPFFDKLLIKLVFSLSKSRRKGKSISVAHLGWQASKYDMKTFLRCVGDWRICDRRSHAIKSLYLYSACSFQDGLLRNIESLSACMICWVNAALFWFIYLALKIRRWNLSWSHMHRLAGRSFLI